MYWLVTWTTYGSWLPGDPRGFRTFRAREYVAPPERYAPDDRVYDPQQYADRYRQAKEQVPTGVELTVEEIAIARHAIVAEIGTLSLEPLILSIEAHHVHLISRFGSLMIRTTVGKLKSAATRAIPNPGDRKRVWAKECHMRSLADETSVQRAYDYVRRHVEQGAVIHEWPPSRPPGGRPE